MEKDMVEKACRVKMYDDFLNAGYSPQDSIKRLNRYCSNIKVYRQSDFRENGNLLYNEKFQKGMFAPKLSKKELLVKQVKDMVEADIKQKGTLDFGQFNKPKDKGAFEDYFRIKDMDGPHFIDKNGDPELNEKLQKYNPGMDDRKFDRRAREYLESDGENAEEDEDSEEQDFIDERIEKNIEILLNDHIRKSIPPPRENITLRNDFWDKYHGLRGSTITIEAEEVKPTEDFSLDTKKMAKYIKRKYFR